MNSNNAGRTIHLLVIVLCMIAASIASASPWQGWRGSGGWGVDKPYHRLYNTGTVGIFSGEVVGIKKTSLMKGMCLGVVLMVKTDKEILPVHLGPSWYIERLDYRIANGDRLEIKGSKISFNGKPAVIAAEILKEDNVLILRDNMGIPVWAGWGWDRESLE